MTDESVRWLAPKPELTDPVLVVVLTGWIDAASAAHGAAEALSEASAANPVATFDDDIYLDFRARRPVMELRDGLNSVLRWERTLLSTGRARHDRDLVLLTGPEPDMAWHRFTHNVGELASELGVTDMVHLGAYPFAVPHTRPPRLSVSSPSHDVLARVPFLRSSIDVPAGVAAALEHEMHGRGIASLGIWAQVPHYIATMSYPAASAALLEGLAEATGIEIDATTLDDEAIVQRQRLDSMVAGNDEHAAMITQIEELYDSTLGGPESDGGPSLEMLSGDELAAEVERYLREQS